MRLGKVKTVELLLSAGIDFRLSNNSGESLLLLACGKGARSIVEKLTDRGENFNRVSNDGRSPLHAAVCC